PVVPLHDHQRALVVDEHGARRSQFGLQRGLAVAPEAAVTGPRYRDDGTVAIDPADPVVARIRDDEPALPVEGNPSGRAEARLRPWPAVARHARPPVARDGRDDPRPRVDAAYAVRARFGDVEVAVAVARQGLDPLEVGGAGEAAVTRIAERAVAGDRG